MTFLCFFPSFPEPHLLSSEASSPKGSDLIPGLDCPGRRVRSRHSREEGPGRAGLEPRFPCRLVLPSPLRRRLPACPRGQTCRLPVPVRAGDTPQCSLSPCSPRYFLGPRRPAKRCQDCHRPRWRLHAGQPLWEPAPQDIPPGAGDGLTFTMGTYSSGGAGWILLDISMTAFTRPVTFSYTLSLERSRLAVGGGLISWGCSCQHRSQLLSASGGGGGVPRGSSGRAFKRDQSRLETDSLVPWGQVHSGVTLSGSE